LVSCVVMPCNPVNVSPAPSDVTIQKPTIDKEQ
jgi:hypothetical protein